jgi:hypothetical protein
MYRYNKNGFGICIMQLPRYIFAAIAVAGKRTEGNSKRLGGA